MGPAFYEVRYYVLFGPILYRPSFSLLPLAAPFMLPPDLSHTRPPPSSRNECLSPRLLLLLWRSLTLSALTGWSEAPPVAFAG